MSLRSTWKGSIQFLLVSVPIKMFAATSDTAEKIAFNLIHKGECQGAVKMPKQCEKCEKPLGKDDIQKAYQYEAGKYVPINQPDLDSVKISSTHAIAIAGFLDLEEIPATYFEQTYYAAPDGPAAEKPFALLREAMKATGQVALGKAVIREREVSVVISVEGAGLLIRKLFYKHEVRTIDQVPGLPISVTKLANEEMTLVKTLVGQMQTTFAELDTEDRYLTQLKGMLAAKVNGAPITVTADAPAPASMDIMAALQASLAQSHATVKKGTAKVTTLKVVGEKKGKKSKAA